MILVYTPVATPRLQYICQFIFGSRLGTAYNITNDKEGFKKFDGLRINYAAAEIPESHVRIIPQGLLQETGIRPQQAECFLWKGRPAFFATTGNAYPFDIFAAAFYLLSRYEEYLPHEKDMYGRFDYRQSLAYRNDFLKIPLIDYWIGDFSNTLRQLDAAVKFNLPTFNISPSFDIDIAWSYRNKGWLRSLGGWLRSPSWHRLQVLRGKKADPYDSYETLNSIHGSLPWKPVYFFLVANQLSRYDRNISPRFPAMRKLIEQHATLYSIGMHPSWQSNENENALLTEKHTLENITGRKIVLSRQHYIKFNLPETYRRLIAAGIEKDYSMGYGSINGFRASVSSAFFWYDLEADKATKLLLQPFCVMDANSYYEQKQNAEQTATELRHYRDVCREVNGTFSFIFHNNILGSDPQFAGWMAMYREFISQLQQ